MGILALFTFALWFTWIIRRDGKEQASVSSSVWIVVAWLFIHSTRPASVWLGLSVSSSRDEGNPVEALFNLIFILAGLIVLWRRGTQLPIVIRDNRWLFVFYLFWLLSVGWSDYPLITFKRLFKEIGNVVMVLIILTEKEPSESVRAACVRLAYLCIPLSIVLIRYYPAWGRTYVGDHGASLMYTGVTTQKNILGVLVLVSALFLLWDLLELSGKSRSRAERYSYTSRVVVLVMGWYLLFLIDSVTSLVCAVFGSALIFTLRLPSFRQNPVQIEVFALSAAGALYLFDSMFDIKVAFMNLLGRDMTLTSRTDIWEVVEGFQDSPLVGAGFDTFWAGERLKELADKTFGIIQAHNGYIETYLNGGWIGVGLLVILLISAYLRLRRKLALGEPEGRIRFVLILVALVHNISEATFNKSGPLWFATIFAIMEYRSQQASRQSIIPSVFEKNDPVGVTPNSAQARNHH